MAVKSFSEFQKQAGVKAPQPASSLKEDKKEEEKAKGFSEFLQGQNLYEAEAKKTEEPKQETVKSFSDYLQQGTYVTTKDGTDKKVSNVDTEGIFQNEYEAAMKRNAVLNVGTGAVNQYAGSMANAGGMVLDNYTAALQKGREWAASAGLMDQETTERLQRENENRELNANALRDFADERTMKGQAQVSAAHSQADSIENKMLSKAAGIAIDVGVSGIQMAMDGALSGLTGANSLAIMFARCYGGGAQEARLEGADLAHQNAYGIASAGVEVLTEMMFDGVAKIYGAGAADDITKQIVTKLASTDNGRNALRNLIGMAGEGVEEAVSDLAAPFTELLKGTKSWDEIDKWDISEIGYDFLVGALSAGITGGVATITGQYKAENAAMAQEDVQKACADYWSSLAKKAENGAEIRENAVKKLDQATQDQAMKMALRGQLNCTEQELQQTMDNLGIEEPAILLELQRQGGFDNLKSLEIAAGALKSAIEKNKAPDVGANVAELFNAGEETAQQEENGINRNQIEYTDIETRNRTQQETHDRMVEEGKVVDLNDFTDKKAEEEFYPNEPGMKRRDRLDKVKQKQIELKEILKNYLKELSGITYELEINGNTIEAKLHGKGIAEVLKRMSQAKMEMVSNSDWLFRNAEYMYSTNDGAGNADIDVWDYFYVPVKIGENITGVRIAVRHVIGENENQIYNWGIKKDAALGGVGHTPNGRTSNDATSATSGITINQNNETVKGEPGFTENEAYQKMRDEKRITEKTARELDMLGKMLGREIILSDNVDENANAYYENGQIVISTNSSDPVTMAAMHEAVHDIKVQDEEAYKNLAEEVFKALSNGNELQRALVETARQYGVIDENGNISVNDVSNVMEEMVAQGTAMIAQDTDLLGQMTAENRTILQRIVDAITDLLDKIRGFRDSGEIHEKDIERYDAIYENLENVRNSMMNALNAVNEAQSEAEAEAAYVEGQPISQENEAKQSRKHNTELMEKAKEYNKKNGGLISEDVMKQAEKSRNLAKELLDREDIRDLLPPDVEGATIINNGSYSKTMENGMVCIRSLVLDELQNLVSNVLGRPLTFNESIYVTQESMNHTDKPECAYCYVAADRKMYSDALSNYLTLRNASMDAAKQGESMEWISENILGIKTKDTKRYNAKLRSRIQTWMNYAKNGTEVLSSEDLAGFGNDKGEIKQKMESLPENKQAEFKMATDYAQHAARAKLRQSYVAYKGDILKMSRNMVNRLNNKFGLRMYSYTDYSPAYVLENMQMVTDAAAKGLKMLAYTKETDFAKVFAPTGMNISVSVHSGKQQMADGSFVMDSMQGADWDKAKALRAQYPNITITMVAESDAQVDWALSQDWIDVVIPFHSVFGGGFNAAEIFGWRNFTQFQHDKKIDGLWKEGNKKEIYPSEHQNDVAKYADALIENNLEPRFAQWCRGFEQYRAGEISAEEFRAMNPNYMKLVNETRRSAGETPAVQPIFDTSGLEESFTEFKQRGGYYEHLGGRLSTTKRYANEMAAEIESGVAAEKVAGYKDRKWSLKQSGEEVERIKEQIKAESKVLNDMDPVANIEIPHGIDWKNKEKVWEWAVKELKKWGYEVDRKNFGIITFDAKSINTGLGYLNTDGEKMAFAALPRVLKRGIIVEHHGNHKLRKHETFTIAAPIMINGVRGNMGVVVMATNKNHYKTHRILTPDGALYEVNEIEARPTPARGVTENGSLATHISLASEETVTQEFENVNVKKESRKHITDDTEAAQIRKASEDATEDGNVQKARERILELTAGNETGLTEDAKKVMGLWENQDVESTREALNMLKRTMNAEDVKKLANNVYAFGDPENNKAAKWILNILAANRSDFDLVNDESMGDIPIPGEAYREAWKEINAQETKSGLFGEEITQETETATQEATQEVGLFGETLTAETEAETAETVAETAETEAAEPETEAQKKDAEERETDDTEVTKTAEELTKPAVNEETEKYAEDPAGYLKTVDTGDREAVRRAVENVDLEKTPIFEMGELEVKVLLNGENNRVIVKDALYDKVVLHERLQNVNEDLTDAIVKASKAANAEDASMSEKAARVNETLDDGGNVDELLGSDEYTEYRERTAKRLSDAEEALNGFYDTGAQPIVQDVKAKTEERTNARKEAEKTTMKEKLQDTWSAFKRIMVNQGDSIHQIAQKLDNKSIDGYYFYAMAGKTRAADWVTNKRSNNLGETTGKSLNEIFDPIRAKGDEYYNAFQSYMYHELNVERMSRSTEKELQDNQLRLQAILAQMPELATMADGHIRNLAEMPIEQGFLAKDYLEAKAEQRRLEKHGNKPVFGWDTSAEYSRNMADALLRENPEFKELAKGVYEYIDDLTQYQVDTGLISQEQANQLKNAYEHYVPVFYDRQTTQRGVAAGNVNVSSGVKAAYGGKEQILPLHVSLARKTQTVMQNAGINQLGNELLRLRDENKSVIEQYILDAQEAEDGWTPDTVDEDGVWKPNAENEITILDNGKRYTLTLDKGMSSAFQSFRPTDSDLKALNLMKAGNDVFKKLCTAWNPYFLVTNAVKDAQDAVFYSSDGARWSANMPKAYEQIKSSGKYWEMYKAMGGVYGSYFDWMTGETEKTGGMIGKLESLNMAIEQAPRLSEFMTILQNAEADHGTITMQDQMEAFLGAQEITTNFGRRGSLGRIINRYLVPFWNPGVQGASKVARSIMETKGAKQWAALIGKAVLLGILPEVINELVYFDDDEWDEISDRNKMNYYLFKGKDGIWYKLPKGRVLAALSSVAVAGMEKLRGDEVDFGEIAEGAIDNVAPNNPLQTNLFSAAISADLFDKDSTGKTWYGSNIESQRLQNYAVSERYDESTDAISKWLGKTLDLSPKKINYIIDQYSGVIGDVLLPLLTPKAERGLFDIAGKQVGVVGASKFTLDTVTSNTISGEYYDLSDELKYDKNSDDLGAAAAYAYMNKRGDEISDIYKKIRDIENDTELTDAEKTTLTRELRKTLNLTMEDIMEKTGKYRETADEYLKGHEELNYNDTETVKAWMDGYNDEQSAEDYFITEEQAASKMRETVKRETNRELFGSEYALEAYNSDVYEKAKKLNEDSGISYDLYYDYYFATTGLHGDKGADGKTISGSKKEKVVEAINALDATPEEKDALYIAAGYTKGTLKSTPWNGGSGKYSSGSGGGSGKAKTTKMKGLSSISSKKTGTTKGGSSSSGSSTKIAAPSIAGAYDTDTAYEKLKDILDEYGGDPMAALLATIGGGKRGTSELDWKL